MLCRPGDVIHDGERKNLPSWADWPLVVSSQDSDPGKLAFEWRAPGSYYWPRVDDGADHCLPKVTTPGLLPAQE